MSDKLIITIGRECGSGGRHIGQKLAEEMGVKCYDKELLTLAAKKSGLCRELFETHDEKPTSSFLYSLVMDNTPWDIQIPLIWICPSTIRSFWPSSIRSSSWPRRNPA